MRAVEAVKQEMKGPNIFMGRSGLVFEGLIEVSFPRADFVRAEFARVARTAKREKAAWTGEFIDQGFCNA